MRRLTLHREVLTELSAAELGAVVGGVVTKICITDPCITPDPYTGLECYGITNGCA